MLLSLYRSLDEPLKRLSEEQPQQAGSGKTAKEPAPHQQRSLLLVDDDEDFLAMMTRWLKKDYDVTAVGSGEQALAYLKKEQPDLVLLDYEMPDMDGSVVLEKIRMMPDCQNVPVMFLTGTEDQDNLKKVEEFHPAGVLIKTLGKKELLAGIAAFFGNTD